VLSTRKAVSDFLLVSTIIVHDSATAQKVWISHTQLSFNYSQQQQYLFAIGGWKPEGHKPIRAGSLWDEFMHETYIAEIWRSGAIFFAAHSRNLNSGRKRGRLTLAQRKCTCGRQRTRD